MKPEAHPLRGVTAEWLPAPSLEALARDRLLILVMGLAFLHIVLALAHAVAPGPWDLRYPLSAFQGEAWERTAFVLAAATALFLIVLRILLPRLPLRWGQPLAALTATLVVINALGIFSLGTTPENTIGVMFAVVGASLLLFCTRTILVVLALAIGGWIGVARKAGFDATWAQFGAALFAACALSIVVQRLQIRSIKQMLRGVAVPAPVAPEPDQRAEDEERFRRWYEATFEGIAIHEKGVILEANKALAGLLQCDLADLAGRNLLDWFTRSSRTVIEESILLGNFRPFEAVARRTNKSEIHLELFSKQIPYRGRNVMVTAFRDISERQRAAAAAQAEQERLQHQYRRQLSLAGISLSGGETVEVGALLDRVVKAAAEELPAHGGAVVLVFENGTRALAARQSDRPPPPADR